MRTLLDDYLPAFDVRNCFATRIAASPARVYASLKTANFDYWGVTRTLYAVRALPTIFVSPRDTWRRVRETLGRKHANLQDMLAGGFSVLAERPDEEFLLGTVGRFWLPHGELRAISPARFREPTPPGTAKSAWNFTVSRRPDGATELRTETRVLCADAATRRSFRAYWMLIKPASAWIRLEMLAAVRNAAESAESPVSQM
jgi:hypothetical protein